MTDTNGTSKDVVLLACPFCGGSVEVGHYHPDLGPSSCFVKCWCGARGTEHQYQHGDHKEAIAKAAASWNRRTVETSGKQPDWEAEYKKLAGVYSRTGLEDFIAKHWPGNKLVDVSAEEPRETIGLICYNPCEKHKGMSFTMTIGTPAVLVRTVCPHCEPIRPEEPSEANSLKCVSAGCANNCEKGNPYLCAEHARSSEKAAVCTCASSAAGPCPAHT